MPISQTGQSLPRGTECLYLYYVFGTKQDFTNIYGMNEIQLHLVTF